MEDGALLITSNMLATLSDNSMDLDLMDDLFYDGSWLETTNNSIFLQQVPSLSPSDSSSFYFPALETSTSHLNSNSHLNNFQEKDNLITVSQRHCRDASTMSESCLVGATELTRGLWIGPSRTDTSVAQRLVQAFECLKNTTRDRDVLIQIWVPKVREGRRVLTTNNQPFSLDPNSISLEYYRNISTRYQFAAEKTSKEFFGLPGRVFLKKMPEWAPDVRLFNREDYPRINFAQQYNIRGSLAIPVFERGSSTCVAVVEIVSSSPKANYHSELDDVCKALEVFPCLLTYLPSLIFCT